MTEKLTRRQLDELRRLAVAPQSNRSPTRAKVQAALRLKGLAFWIIDTEGKDLVVRSCKISDAGRLFLQEIDSRKAVAS